MKAKNCPFCGTESPPLWADEADEAWRNLRKRTLAVAGEVTLCAGLGAIAEPYVLAYTREHHLALSATSNKELSDLFDALDLCLGSGMFPSGSLSVFEHGGGSAQNATGCLEHCHLHIIDGAHDLRLGLKQTYPDSIPVRMSESDNLPHSAGYLFTGRYEGGRVLDGQVAHVTSCGSQFFRRLLAAQMGRLDWNWRLSPKPEAAMKVCREWSSHHVGSSVRESTTAL